MKHFQKHISLQIKKVRHLQVTALFVILQPLLARDKLTITLLNYDCKQLMLSIMYHDSSFLNFPPIYQIKHSRLIKLLCAPREDKR